MADLVVGMSMSVVDGALTKAKAAIEEDGKLRKSAQRNLVFITGEFQMMQSFLKVAHSERMKNAVVRTWVRQIRDLAYDVEDCIEFVVHLDKKNRWWLRLLTPCMAPLPLDEAVAELELLKARVEDVSSRNARYSLISDSGSEPAAVAPQQQQQQVVFNRLTPREMRHEDLTKFLLLNKRNPDLRVISIWGTGGGGDLGMESIFWNTYIDEETRKYFTYRAWVKLMHPFNPHEFVRSLMALFYANSCKEEGTNVGVQVTMKMEATLGGDPLKDFERLVRENRYLVVLEDVSTMIEWDAIRRFFPNNRNGSCIILCTQQFNVASLSVGHPYQVLHLNKLAVERSVYAFFKEGSPYDGDEGIETNNAPAINFRVSIDHSKREAAERWLDEHPLVGRQQEMRDLGITVITARAKSYQVISVWGIVGVGKSALIKNIFCDKIANCRLFQKYGWVDVSHPFNLWDFSRILLSNFGSEYLQTSETADLCTINPILQCREILERHRCLVVIDGL